MSDERLYSWIVLALCAALLVGIRPGTWGFLRVTLLVHVLGDYAFGSFWDVIPTYAFLRNISVHDKIVGGTLLLACVSLTDLAYRLSFRLGALVRRGAAAAPGRSERAARAEARYFPTCFLVAGIVCKLIFLGGTGVLMGQRSYADLKPSDTLGFGAVVFLSDFLIPYGFSALRRAGRARWPVLVDWLAMALLAFLSISKALFLWYVVIYTTGLALGLGSKVARRNVLNWRFVVLLALAVLNVGIKSQQRAGGAVDVGGAALLENAATGSSARFMGGVYRTYLATVREIRAGWPPLGGAYHGQVFVILVPRVLWPDKPHVASEQLYYLLGVVEESYGTAFSVNTYGAFVFDFGIGGALLGAVLFGGFLFLGDRHIPRGAALRERPDRGLAWHYFATAWIFSAAPLAEAGIPIAIVSFTMLSAAFAAIYGASRLAFEVLAAAGARPPERVAAPAA